ncbi:MAG: hypothetical protein GY757_30825 [bacterium]|nr:hypothetical protein [bacterium]
MKEKRDYKKYDWGMVETEYITVSTSTYSSLSKKYKIPKRKIEQRGSAHNWVEKRRQHVVKKAAEVQEKDIIQEVDRIQKVKEDERLSTSFLEKAIMSQLLEKAPAGGAKLNKKLKPKDLLDLAKASEILQRMKYRSYGIGKKDEPEDEPGSYTEQEDRFKEIAKEAREEMDCTHWCGGSGIIQPVSSFTGAVSRLR